MRSSSLSEFRSLVLVAGCGPSYPTRYVLERDIGPLAYRRYQRVLDVEFPIQGNEAVGNTATYVRRTDHGEPPYVNVFVTVYDHPASLTAELRHQVQSLESYDVAVADVGRRSRAWQLDGGTDDRWTIWVSSRFVVKIGGNASAELMRDVISTYMGMYPSDLDDHGRARDGTPKARVTRPGEVAVEQERMEMPRSLGGEGNYDVVDACDAALDDRDRRLKCRCAARSGTRGHPRARCVQGAARSAGDRARCEREPLSVLGCSAGEDDRSDRSDRVPSR